MKPLYDMYILKRLGDYCLADKSGEIILELIYDKIKPLGEYILVKQGKYYQISIIKK